MILYDKSGQMYSFDINGSNLIGYGTNATIHKVNDNECVKIFTVDSKQYFDEDMFKLFKSLSLDGFAKLGIPFYVDDKIRAYTMEYLRESSVSIINMPTEYTLDNLNALYKDILVLSKNLITAFDLYDKNIITTDDKMKIIDYDSYGKLGSEKDALYVSTANLLYAFKGLYVSALTKQGFDIDTKMIGNMTLKKYLSYLFNYSNYEEEPVRVLERRLIGVRTPIELFDRKW